MKEKTTDEMMLEHNKMIIEILTECDYMIKNRFYMNELAIKNCAERIKNIVNFYVQEVNWLDE